MVSNEPGPGAQALMTTRVELFFHTERGWPLLVETGITADDWRFPGTGLKCGDDLLSAIRRVAGGLGVEARHHVDPLTIACRAATLVPGEIRFVLFGGRLTTEALTALSPVAAEYRRWAVRPWDQWSAPLSPERVRLLWLAEQARDSDQLRYLAIAPREILPEDQLDSPPPSSPLIQEKAIRAAPEESRNGDGVHRGDAR